MKVSLAMPLKKYLTRSINSILKSTGGFSPKSILIDKIKTLETKYWNSKLKG